MLTLFYILFDVQCSPCSTYIPGLFFTCIWSDQVRSTPKASAVYHKPLNSSSSQTFLVLIRQLLDLQVLPGEHAA